MHPDVLNYSNPISPTPTDLKKGLIEFDEEDMQEIQVAMDIYGIKGVCAKELHYPSKLFQVRPQPYVLYYMGDISLLDKNILAIVGPRTPTEYAERVLSKLFSISDDYHMVTISGLALGVDQMAHQMSIEHGIPTIAVLGGGLGRYLQQSDRHLLQKIVDNGGLVISEFRLFQAPENYTFPQRNRIIAGLADAVFLPEAGKKSGSLITVDFADKMGIPVYGTPHDIFSSQSEGLHEQIQSGKISPVFNFSYFLRQFFSLKSQNIKTHAYTIELSPDEHQIFDCISTAKTCSIEDLSLQTKKSPSILLAILSCLEIKSLISQISPGKYIVI